MFTPDDTLSSVNRQLVVFLTITPNFFKKNE